MSDHQELRNSQLISYWGPGALVPLAGEKIGIVADPTLWAYPDMTNEQNGTEQWRINDPRLCARLNVDELRLPPVYHMPRVMDRPVGVPLKLFPQNYYCSACLEIQKPPFLPLGKKFRCRNSSSTQNEYRNCKRSSLIPFRLVLVCADGHISDIDIFGRFFTITKIEPQALRLKPDNSGEWLNYRIIYARGDEEVASLSIRDLLKEGTPCSGQQPWLGEGKRECCSKMADIKLIGSSALYFTHQTCSIYLPDDKGEVITFLREKIDEMASIFGMEGVINYRVKLVEKAQNRFGIRYSRELIDSCFDEVVTKSESNDEQMSECEYRTMEYDFFLRNQNARIPANAPEMITYKTDCSESLWLSTFFDTIIAINKLKVTRAYMGFSRLTAGNRRNEPESRNCSTGSWLPAVSQVTEGIFFKFNDDRMAQWCTQDALTCYGELLGRFPIQNAQWHPKYVLIHSFAHALIDEVAMTSGYPASSIRERIYCDEVQTGCTTHGLLIYVTSGDAQGALGGLVGKAEPHILEETIRNALSKAEWCSSDPVCSESTGQGAFNANLAACHYCLLLPDTSCENQNACLDRNALISNGGYFKEL